VSKQQIGELFSFNREAVEMPALTKQKIDLLSHDRLRRSIPILIAVFLFCTSITIIVRVYVDYNQTLRQAHTEMEMKLELASLHMSQRLVGDAAEDVVPRTPTREDMQASLFFLSQQNGFLFFAYDSNGSLQSSIKLNSDIRSEEMSVIAQEASKNSPELEKIDLKEVGALGSVYIGRSQVAGHPSQVILVWPKSEALSSWWQDTSLYLTLLLSVFFVLILMSGAFYWQSSRADEAEAELAEATCQFDKALDRGKCGLWNWDLAQGHIYWSRSMFDLLGMEHSKSKLSFGELSELLHPDDKSFYAIIEQLVRQNEKYLDHEFRMRHRDGQWVWLRTRVEASPSGPMQTPHLVGIAIDITAQKEADRMKKKSETRLADGIEAISEAFVLWDEKNRLVMCNDKYRQFYKLSESTTQPGARYEDVTAQAREPKVRSRLEHTNGHENQNRFEVQLQDNRWLQINDRRTRDGGFVSVGTDITTLKVHEERLKTSEGELMQTIQDLEHTQSTLEKQAQELVDLAEKYGREKTRAESANKSKTKFLANMSHDLRTPLNAIIGFSQMLAGAHTANSEDEKGSKGKSAHTAPDISAEQRVAYANIITGAGQGLTKVIEDILDMSKIEAGRYSLAIEPSNLGSIISESVKLMELEAKKENISLTNNCPQDFELPCDKHAMTRLMQNLLSNAIKFTPENGSVSVEADIRDDAVTICVADTGIGISPKDVEKIGQPFEQVEDQMNKSHKGSGLGLSISKGIVELHGGSLKIESEQGVGTKVFLTLPQEFMLKQEDDILKSARSSKKSKAKRQVSKNPGQKLAS